MNKLGRAEYIFCSIGITINTCLPVWSQGIDHSLGPIKQAQSSDPAGFQLMIFCIGLLVFMVFGLFAGTIFYFVQDKKEEGKSPDTERFD